MRHLCRGGHKNILNHQQLRLGKRFFHMVCVRVTLHRVFPHHIEGFHGTVTETIQHFRYGSTHPVGQLGSPGISEFLLSVNGGNRLISRIHIGQASHITGPLHVVLSP